MAKVLIIDDDKSIVAILEVTFKKNGFEVITTFDGTNGLNKAKTDKPNIILLDQVLPDISGNEVLKTLKQDNITQSIPVAMLSNFGQQELIQEAINAGAKDYILKYQVEPQDIVNKVNEILKENGTTGSTSATSA